MGFTNRMELIKVCVWKFNNSLLRDEEFVKKVKDDIKQMYASKWFTM
jgi:hypothetical protein